MLESFLQIITETIQTHELTTKEDYILVGISGGPDSVFLGYALHQLGYRIGIAHVNYGLRGDDSEREEELVRELAAKWKVRIHVHAENPKEHTNSGISLQMKTREIRYDFFERLLRNEGYTHCATAHHADDQVESLLMSLIKGNSPSIWKGIPIKRGPYIRPLIQLRKNEILEEVKQLGLPYSDDYTNFGTDYLRNRFRNEVLPIFADMNPSISPQLLDRNNWYQQQQTFQSRVLEPFLEGITISKNLDWMGFVEQFGKESLPILISAAAEKWGLHGNEIWQVVQLAESQVGKFVLTQAGKILRSRKGLVLSYLETELSTQSKQIFELESETHSLQFGDMQMIFTYPIQETPDFNAMGTHYFSQSSLHFPLNLRHWKRGDKMIPLGMKTHKKLSDIFVDEKFSAHQKQTAVVIEDQKGIICLSSFRIADRVKIGKNIKDIIKLEIKKT